MAAVVLKFGICSGGNARMKRKPPLTNTWPISLGYSEQREMNALLFERPIWFATGPLSIEEEAQEMEDSIYHRPVLVGRSDRVACAASRRLVVDATCGGGGHTEAILRAGAECSRSRSGSGRD